MEKTFEVLSEILKNLSEKGVKKIGIQLPDGLKYKVFEIVDFIEEKGFEVSISGSSCYGACDLDLEILKDVDVLLHFAHTPIFNLKNVYYVPYTIDYDVDRLEIDERKIALISTAQYVWKLPIVKRKLESLGYEVELRRGSDRVVFPGQVLGCNYTVLRNSKADAVLFIGDGLFHPLGAKLYTKKKVYRFSPLSWEFDVIEDTKIDEFLKKRILRVYKAMDGDRGAIVVCNKIGQKRGDLALDLKRKAREIGRRVDIIYLDEITPTKLENFPYDYYVNTACPRITYDDAELFKVPVISPQEFEILLGLRDWNDYEMDEIV